MRQVGLYAIANLPSVILAAGAVVLAAGDSDVWGWFVLGAILLHCDLKEHTGKKGEE